MEEKILEEKTIKNIEKELHELYPRKSLAYLDFLENQGSRHAKQFWDIYEILQTRWNELVIMRNKLLEKRMNHNGNY